MRIIHWCMITALLTASFDIFLVVQVGGTLRLAQLLMIPVVFAGLAWIVQHGTVLWPRGGFALLLFTLFQGPLIFRSQGLPIISVQLFLILLFTVLGVFATLQIYGRSSLLPSLFRYYLISYVAVGIFGLLQFFAPMLHLGQPLIMQWIKHGVIPRINGFNYEPSYFATYLVMGWIMLIDLRFTRAKVTENRRWFWFAVMLSVAFFLSTSKTAWLILILEGILRLLPYLWRRVRVFFAYLATGRVIIRRPRPWLAIVAVVLVFAVAAGLTALNHVVDLNVFLAGSGLNNTAAHSLNDRTDRFLDTWVVVKNHPLLGLGLGGVAAEIATMHGAVINSASEQRLWWGFPVPLDTLAASGIFGFLPFVWFFAVISFGERKLMRTHWNDERAKWLHALIRALAFEWLILLGDQYLLRVYFWFHVTMVVLIAYNLRYMPLSQGSSSTHPEERLVAA